ncbi:MULTISPECIES: DUF4920 domain-containing protein [Mesoflavibacter]|uniref:DUF4920 domain-containing protein n=1 Tax=Mesoflavibacter profundi TaxID=2708110 RepID=A0ABT4RW67_9FLAO|nr:MULTISPECIES: DUF4920 domain-containing protein [Mesoflavibacter]MDA0175985.1 DUF4920 domain-containing protein [Mesoflavibacter profundi]QIJ89614.1 hypothetical protein C7H62_1805 [Mesoflavibacter sp. HG96]QIJ92342.1 hypothetical protein C7H56_1805 [Mesoflavibacter sp. HG37]
MKKYLLIIAVAAAFYACKEETKNNVEEQVVEKEVVEVKYKSFGKEIMADDAIAANSMLTHYKDLKVGDTIDTKVKLKVNEVCQAKGCWMTADLGDGNEVRVTFKDYGFFMPKNISGEEVIVNGKAFVKEMPVEELRHYAEDAGKSKEEIEAITDPERTYSLVADGVLLVEK